MLYSTKKLGQKFTKMDPKALVNCHDCKHANHSEVPQKDGKMCLNHEGVCFIKYWI